MAKAVVTRVWPDPFEVLVNKISIDQPLQPPSQQTQRSQQRPLLQSARGKRHQRSRSRHVSSCFVAGSQEMLRRRTSCTETDTGIWTAMVCTALVYLGQLAPLVRRDGGTCFEATATAERPKVKTLMLIPRWRLQGTVVVKLTWLWTS